MKFTTIENNVNPQRFLKFLPKRLLNLLSVLLTSIFVDINAKIKVIKVKNKDMEKENES